MTTLEHGQLLTDEQYYEAMEEYGDEFTRRWAPRPCRTS
jgi:DNA-directed RNA polymerase subunit beta'